MSEYVIGVDVGSGSARAGVFDKYGKRLGMAVYPILQFRPKKDHVEQSSTDIWLQVCNAVKDAVSQSKIDPNDILGIGFDATCSLVALDSDNQPTTVSTSGNNNQNIIMWMDHRAIEEAAEINATQDDALKYVGGEVSPEMELPKILWLKKYMPEKYKNISKLFDLADFLVFRASGNPVRSVCTKSCKWNYLAHENNWAQSLLEKTNLTDIIEDGKIEGVIEVLGKLAGKLTEEAAKELGLTTKTAVSTGIIDAHAGGLAIIGDEPESTLAIIGGTSSCHMAVTQKETFVPGVWGPYWGAMLPDYWLLEGGQSAAGALIDHVIRSSSEYQSLRQRAEIEKRTVYEILNQKVIELEEENPQLMSNFHMLGYHHGNRSPRANPTLKGMVTGLSLDESLDALAIEYLAAIQSVAYGTRHIIEAMRQSGHDITKITMCGGGTKNQLWLREHADITGCEVVLPSESEAVILGAAMLGATASGVHGSLSDAVKNMGSAGKRVLPSLKRKDFHDAKYQVFLEMYEDQMKYKAMMAQANEPILLSNLMEFKVDTLNLQLPKTEKRITVDDKTVVMVSPGDLRESANKKCWPVQSAFEKKFTQVMNDTFGYEVVRGHDYNAENGHGFIASQREGCDVLAGIDENAPIVVVMTAWQYSHHLAPALCSHKGPILLLANFDGEWPGLVGALCMAGTLTSMGREYSRLWSENLDDEFFLNNMETWLSAKKITHDTSYLNEITFDAPMMSTAAAKTGREVGEYILKNKEIMGLFDSFCMGMMNGVFPQKSLVDIGMPMEGLSQSALLHEMSLVTPELKEACLKWYEERGMTFHYGSDGATELTREQVLEQCAMMIAMARFTKRFGLSSVGVQYQQGLKDSCPASDFAEGAIGSAERFPIPDENGDIIRQGKPIPCINEVDMGTGIPQTMLFRLLDSLGLPSETTLHDIRWGSEFEGTFYWDFEISGSVPFEHLKGGIAGAQGHRQPAMYFPLGGSSIGGQCKAGKFVWARAHYEGEQVIMHVGTGSAYELPEQEFTRRLEATTREWPLMNCVLDGVSRNDLMAGHQSNHITVAYVPEDRLDNVVTAFAAQALTQNMKVFLAK